jgi:hypothetical protein
MEIRPLRKTGESLGRGGFLALFVGIENPRDFKIVPFRFGRFL